MIRIMIILRAFAVVQNNWLNIYTHECDVLQIISQQIVSLE